MCSPWGTLPKRSLWDYSITVHYFITIIKIKELL